MLTIRSRSGLLQIISQADALAEGVGAGFDWCRVGFHLVDGPQAHGSAVDAAVRRARTGNVDFLDGTELAASGFSCGLGSALTVVDGFFDQVFLDLVGVFIGKTDVLIWLAPRLPALLMTCDTIVRSVSLTSRLLVTVYDVTFWPFMS